MAWLLAPAPAERLAVLRILVGSYAVVWSLARLPAHLAHTNQPAARWQPLGVLAPFGDPLPAAVIVALSVGTPLLGLAFVAGYRYRATAPAFALVFLAVTTLDSSWGQIFHTENLVVLHVVILALAPAAADTLAMGPRHPGVPAPSSAPDDGHGPGPPSPDGGGGWRVRWLAVFGRGRPVPSPDGRYGWPVRLAALVVVVAYVLAGIAKLRIGGGDWPVGDVLRNLVAHDNLRKALLGDAYSPIGTELVRFGWLFPPFAIATLAVELGAAVTLLGGRWRTLWVAVAWLFHVGVLALMAILFPYQLTGIAFAPFFALERLPARLPLPPRAHALARSASPQEQATHQASRAGAGR